MQHDPICVKHLKKLN